MTDFEKESFPQAALHRVFVGNLSYEVDNDKLKAHFGDAGEMYVAVY